MASLKYKDPETGEWHKIGLGSGVVTEAEMTTAISQAVSTKAPTIQYSTEEVEAGSASPYPEGTLYVVIE